MKSHQVEKETFINKFLNQRVCKNYVIKEFLGNGSFCGVFKAKRQPIIQKTKSSQNLMENKQIIKQNLPEYYAVKIEDQRGAKSGTLTMNREVKVIKAMSGTYGFVKLYSHQKEPKYHYTVTTVLGKTIKDLQVECGGKFQMNTICILACQLINRLEALHKKGYIHRDLKPQNMMIGAEQHNKNIVYLIDFGLSTTITRKDGSHVPMSKISGFVGTTKFISVNSHQGLSQSRRDDMESLGYVLVYLAKGNLPWKTPECDDPAIVNEEVGFQKKRTDIDDLCFRLPGEFEKYFQYVKGLQYFEEPCYNYLKGLFKQLLYNLYKPQEFTFEWVLKEENENKIKNQQQQQQQQNDNTIKNNKNNIIEEKQIDQIQQKSQQFQQKKNIDGNSALIKTRSLSQKNQNQISQNNKQKSQYFTKSKTLKLKIKQDNQSQLSQQEDNLVQNQSFFKEIDEQTQINNYNIEDSELEQDQEAVLFEAPQINDTASIRFLSSLVQKQQKDYFDFIQNIDDQQDQNNQKKQFQLYSPQNLQQKQIQQFQLSSKKQNLEKNNTISSISQNEFSGIQSVSIKNQNIQQKQSISTKIEELNIYSYNVKVINKHKNRSIIE